MNSIYYHGKLHNPINKLDLHGSSRRPAPNKVNEKKKLLERILKNIYAAGGHLLLILQKVNSLRVQSTASSI